MPAPLSMCQAASSESLVYHFDQYRLDATQWTLHSGNTVVRLEPKVFDTLLVLVERAGQTVSKEVLARHLWPDTVVEDGGLTRNVSILRTALQDSPPFKFIETVRNQGYRFCCDVQIQAHESATIDPPSADGSHDGAPPKVFKPALSFAAWLPLGILGLLVLSVLLDPYRSTRPYSLEQLTSNSVELPILHAALSPDGKMLAFSDSSHLYVGDTQVKERHVVRLPESLVPTDVEWFPDNTHILVSSFNLDTGATSIWKIFILGGPPELIMQDARNAAAFPDKKRIVFIRKESQLWIANSNGSAARLFAAAKHQDKFVERPQISANNDYIVALRITSGGLRSIIEAHRISDGASISLFETSALIKSFCLRGDNELVVSIIPEDNQFNSQIISMSVALSTGKHSAPHVIVDWPGSIASDLSTSVNLELMTAVRNVTSADAYVADLAPDENSITHSRRLTLNQSVSRPAGWLPDNHTILFYSNRFGTYGIYSQDIESTNAEALATDLHDNIRPAASADQKWLFYFSNDEQHVSAEMETSLMRMPMEAGQPQRIDTKPDFYRSIRCAARANQCALEEHTSTERIFIAFDPAQGRGNELLRTSWVRGINPYDWDLSPDGTHIAFIDEAHDPNDVDIFDVKSPLEVQRMHVDSQSPLHTLMWDAKGTGFYVSAFRTNDLLLKLFHVNSTGELHLLRTDQHSDHGWAIPSPDGHHLLTQQYTHHSNIWLLKQ